MRNELARVRVQGLCPITVIKPFFLVGNTEELHGADSAIPSG
jgi:hypothetical protein